MQNHHFPESRPLLHPANPNFEKISYGILTSSGPMKKRPISCLPIILLPVAAALCLLIFWGLNYIQELPGRAEEVFGPADLSLSELQKIRLAWMLLAEEDALLTPKDPAAKPSSFSIPFGESVPSMVSRLEDDGLIADRDSFLTYLRYRGLDRTIQAGDYQLSPAMTPVEIALGLQDASPTEVTIQLLAGWRLEEVAEALAISGLNFSAAEFQNAARSRPMSTTELPYTPSGASLEGFLYPGRYTFKRDSTPQDVLTLLLANFELQVDDFMRAGFKAQDLDLYQAVTLASIVEREAVNEEESPLIASVFLNRLALGMRLDADPTVQYALGYNQDQQTWWTNPLTLEDLKIDSPFNTYLYPLLPPGPISNPGQAALQAVANPAESSYLYFRAACDGSGDHNFAFNFEEHKSNACP